MAERSRIGERIVLWRTEYKLDAYKDQFGIAHSGYLVHEQIPVVITETRKVPNMWGKGQSDGYKAIAVGGEEYYLHWNVYPDDSMTPNFYWDVREDSRGLWQPEDGIQAYNRRGGPFIDSRTNARAVPIEATICAEHDEAYLPDDKMGCWKCYMAKRKAEKCA